MIRIITKNFIFLTKDEIKEEIKNTKFEKIYNEKCDEMCEQKTQIKTIEFKYKENNYWIMQIEEEYCL